MPTMKRNVANAPTSTGFESYDGPELPKQNRMYRGVIKSAKIREASTGTIGINLLVIFEAEDGNPDSKYDGYPAWVDLWLADKEPNQAREYQFYRAVGVAEAKLKSGDIPISHDDIDDGGKINKVGGKNPVGAVVKVDMRTDRYGDEIRMKGDAVFPAKQDSKKGKAAADEEPEPSEEDLLEDATDTEDADEEYEARVEELEGWSLPKLRKLAKGDYDMDVKGLNAEGLREAILAHEFPDDAESVEDETVDEPDEPDEDEELYATVKALALPKLRKWAQENGEYSAADLKGLDKDDILEMLVDDEVLSEPPF